MQVPQLCGISSGFLIHIHNPEEINTDRYYCSSDPSTSREPNPSKQGNKLQRVQGGGVNLEEVTGSEGWSRKRRTSPWCRPSSQCDPEQSLQAGPKDTTNPIITPISAISYYWLETPIPPLSPPTLTPCPPPRHTHTHPSSSLDPSGYILLVLSTLQNNHGKLCCSKSFSLHHQALPVFV